MQSPDACANVPPAGLPDSQRLEAETWNLELPGFQQS
jgi:hypothetical protein